MKITYVITRLHKGQSRLKGIASITFNNSFVVHNIKIIDGRNGMFVAMPSAKNLKGVYLDIAHPINSDTRQMIDKHIKDAFQQMLDASEERKEIDLVDSKEYSPLQITDVRVKFTKKQSRLKGISSITFNNSFVVHNIKIIDGRNGIFVAMPSTKNLKGVYLDIAHPINSDTRQMIKKHIEDTFQQMLANLPLEEK